MDPLVPGGEELQVNRLLVVGFYLVNLGYVFVALNTTMASMTFAQRSKRCR